MAETWIVPRLLAIEGVADARILGGAEPIIKIVLDRTMLRLRGITADEVFRTLSSLDDLRAAGLVHADGEDKLVAIRGDIDLDALRGTVVARRGERTYTLGMLGRVEENFDDPTYFVRENGRNVVQARVEKRSGSNSVAVSRRVRDALPDIQAAVPFEVTFSIDEDLGRDLEDKLRELIARSGVILLLLFLLLVISLRQVRLTATVVASIFFAIVICLSLFYFLKLSVNFITISGLTVCFGLILDNSILVLDAIHRRLHALEQASDAGLSRIAKHRVAVRMIVSGTNEVMFPILATTLTTIVAFFSFIFLSGRLALYYIPLAISVTTAMAASIFIAFAWIPVVLNQGWARWIVSHTPDGDRDLTDDRALDAFVADRPATEERPNWLERLLSPWIRVWWLVLPATLVLFGWTWKTYDEEVFKGGFAGFPETEELFMYLEMPAGTDVRVTSETLLRFEELLDPVPEGARARSQVFDNQAVLRVEFERDLLVTETPTLYRSLLVEQADATAGTTIFIRGFADGPYLKGSFGGSSLNSLIELTGYNSKRLNEIAERTLREVSRQRRVRNARITTGGRFERSSLEETVIALDRRELAEHGLTVAQLSSRIRRILGVDVPWSMLIDGKQERVQLRFDDAESIQFADVESDAHRDPERRSDSAGRRRERDHQAVDRSGHPHRPAVRGQGELGVRRDRQDAALVHQARARRNGPSIRLRGRGGLAELPHRGRGRGSPTHADARRCVHLHDPGGSLRERLASLPRSVVAAARARGRRRDLLADRQRVRLLGARRARVAVRDRREQRDPPHEPLPHRGRGSSSGRGGWRTRQAAGSDARGFWAEPTSRDSRATSVRPSCAERSCAERDCVFARSS